MHSRPGSEARYRREICNAGRCLRDLGFLPAAAGNFSVRLKDGSILATPSGVPKGEIEPGDLLRLTGDGKPLAAGTRGKSAASGSRSQVSSEISMHLRIYRLRPDVRAICHAHPPVATGFAAAGRPLNLALLPEVIIGLGCVPLADYGLPGTPALTEPLLPYIPKYDAIMMGNHGAVSYGEDVYKAFFRMETVEHFARISLVAELLGGPTVLPKAEVDKLFDSRTRYGIKARAGAEPGCPVYAEQMPQSIPPSPPAAGSEERFYVTRDELIGMVDEALRARGVS